MAKPKPGQPHQDARHQLLLAVFRASLDSPELFYPDMISLLGESKLFQREAQKQTVEIKFVARDYASPEDFFDSLDAENIQYVLLFTENTALVQQLRSARHAVRELRASYTEACKAILARVQADDEERSLKKKDILQQQVRCIYGIVKKRDRELSEAQTAELQRIISELIDKCQTELDQERAAAFDEMERVLKSQTAAFEDQESRLMQEVTQLEEELAEMGINDERVLMMLIVAEVWEMPSLREACLDYVSRRFETFADRSEWQSPLLQRALTDFVEMVERNIDILRTDNPADDSTVTLPTTPAPQVATPSATPSETNARRFLDGFLSRRVVRQQEMERAMRKKAEQITLNKLLQATGGDVQKKMTIEQRLYRLRILFQETEEQRREAADVDLDLVPAHFTQSPAQRDVDTMIARTTRLSTPRVASPRPEDRTVSSQKFVLSPAAVAHDAAEVSAVMRAEMLREHEADLATAVSALVKEVDDISHEVVSFLGTMSHHVADIMTIYKKDASTQPPSSESPGKRPAINYLDQFKGHLPTSVLVDKVIQNANMVATGRPMLSRTQVEPTRGLSGVVNPRQRLVQRKTPLIIPESEVAARIHSLGPY